MHRQLQSLLNDGIPLSPGSKPSDCLESCSLDCTTRHPDDVLHGQNGRLRTSNRTGVRDRLLIALVDVDGPNAGGRIRIRWAVGPVGIAATPDVPDPRARDGGHLV